MNYKYFDGMYEIEAFQGTDRFLVNIENTPDGQIVVWDRAGETLVLTGDQFGKFEPQFVRKYEGPESWDSLFPEKKKRVNGPIHFCRQAERSY